MGGAFLSRPHIAETQLKKLRGLLEAISGNLFYAKKVLALGLKHPVTSLEEFLRLFPFTTKSEIVADQIVAPPYGTNLTFPLSDYTRFHQTSGTTGTPLRWLDTPESWQWMVENWMEVFQAAGTTRSDRVYFAFSFGPFLGFWLAFDAAHQLGCLCLPGGGLGSKARLRAILDNDATVLCCTPTYAVRLAEVAAEEKIDLRESKIKTIIVAGEPGGSIPATRAHLQQLWPGARVFDHHGMTEVGPVTYECPLRPGILHVIETSYLAEIVDPKTSLPVAAGKTGELILTTLGRTASPLLRYRTGDLVKATTQMPCACGRHELAFDGGILGRVDDMVVVRGVNIFPSAVEDVLRGFAEIAEYRVQLNTTSALVELALEIELKEDATDAVAISQKLEHILHSTFNLRVPVRTVAAGTLPRFEMKAKRWVRS